MPGKAQTMNATTATTPKMSFTEVIEALKARFGDINKIELYEATNDMAWDTIQLADAIGYDGLSLHEPYFEIHGDTIREQVAIDGMEYNLVYTIREAQGEER